MLFMNLDNKEKDENRVIFKDRPISRFVENNLFYPGMFDKNCYVCYP